MNGMINIARSATSATQKRGSLSALVVCLAMSGFACVALVVDGGRTVSRYASLADHAQNVARLGGQSVVGIRSGRPRIDHTASRLAMRRYLQQHNLSGDVDVHDGQIVVTLSERIPMSMLGLLGITHKVVRVSRSAELVSG